MLILTVLLLVYSHFIGNPGDYCAANDICLDSSICTQNRCTCANGLFIQNGKCVPPKGGHRFFLFLKYHIYLFILIFIV